LIVLRWFWANLSSLVLALTLGVIVWAVAILNADPTDTRELGSPVAIEYVDLPQGLLIIGDPPPATGEVTLRAPASVWEQLVPSMVHLRVNLAGLEEGTHSLPVEPAVEVRPARVTEFQPQTVRVALERAATASVPVNVVPVGEPQLGYRTAGQLPAPVSGVVLGPLSLVERVVELRASVNVSDALQDFQQEVPLFPLDQAGNVVEGVTLDPPSALVSVVIEPREAFRLVSVIPKLEGEEQLVAAGYQINDVTVLPTVVTVFSSDVAALEILPGFVETLPLSIGQATGDIERRLALVLPEGVSLVEEQSVLVRVSVSPIIRTITLTREVETRNLAQGLFALLSPRSVNIIVSGPLPTLNALRPEDVRVIVDLLDLGSGTHQVPPVVIIAPTDVEQESIFPTVVEVILSTTPPPTSTP
jgi:YbbR domain-containing protein